MTARVTEVEEGRWHAEEDGVDEATGGPRAQDGEKTALKGN